LQIPGGDKLGTGLLPGNFHEMRRKCPEPTRKKFKTTLEQKGRIRMKKTLIALVLLLLLYIGSQ